MDPDFALQEDVNALKNLSLDTQTLYLRVCHLMFFKYGVMPTTNKLYQLVHKGSMTVVSEVVKLFLAQLREKSRVLVDNGGLPDHVREEAGELLGALWRRALESAEANLETFKAEAEDKVRVANEHTREAENKAALAQARTAHLTEHVSQLEREKGDLSERLDASNMAYADLQRQMESLKEKTAEVQAQLEQSKRESEAQAARSQEQLQAQEAYYKDVEKRAMTEVDRHRVDNKSLRVQVDSLNSRIQNERIEHEQAMSSVRERLAKQEVHLGAALAERDRIAAELARLNSSIEEHRAERAGTKGRAQRPARKALSAKKLRGNLSTRLGRP